MGRLETRSEGLGQLGIEVYCLRKVFEAIWRAQRVKPCPKREKGRFGSQTGVWVSGTALNRCLLIGTSLRNDIEGANVRIEG